MALAAYSTTNLTNSLAEHLADVLLEVGYLLYWPTLDSLQTNGGVYPEFQANQATVLQDFPEVALALSEARGILTIGSPDFSFPQYSVRPNSDGAATAPEDMPVPSIVLQVEHEANGQLLGLGSRQRARYASLSLYGLARDYGEQIYLADVLRVNFDESQFLDIRNHDVGTRDAVGAVEIQGTDVGTAIFPLGPDSKAFEFTLNARLRYEA
jgi:hypothetical protein